MVIHCHPTTQVAEFGISRDTELLCRSFDRLLAGGLGRCECRTCAVFVVGQSCLILTLVAGSVGTRYQPAVTGSGRRYFAHMGLVRPGPVPESSRQCGVMCRLAVFGNLGTSRPGSYPHVLFSCVLLFLMHYQPSSARPALSSYRSVVFPHTVAKPSSHGPANHQIVVLLFCICSTAGRSESSAAVSWFVHAPSLGPPRRTHLGRR